MNVVVGNQTPNRDRVGKFSMIFFDIDKSDFGQHQQTVRLKINWGFAARASWFQHDDVHHPIGPAHHYCDGYVGCGTF